MTQDERHSAHLRKKRTQKTARRADETRLKVMAKWDPKAREKLEKAKVMDTLSGNRNVTIVGHTGPSKKGTQQKDNGKGKKFKIDAKEVRGKRWKHNLTETLMAKK